MYEKKKIKNESSKVVDKIEEAGDFNKAVLTKSDRKSYE